MTPCVHKPSILDNLIIGFLYFIVFIKKYNRRVLFPAFDVCYLCFESKYQCILGNIYYQLQ